MQNELFMNVNLHDLCTLQNETVAECRVHPTLVKCLPKDRCNEESVLLNICAFGWELGQGEGLQEAQHRHNQRHQIALGAMYPKSICAMERGPWKKSGVDLSRSEYMKERGGEEGERERTKERLARRGRVFMHAQVRGLVSNRLPPFPPPWFPKSHHTEAKQIYGCA